MKNLIEFTTIIKQLDENKEIQNIDSFFDLSWEQPVTCPGKDYSSLAYFLICQKRILANLFAIAPIKVIDKLFSLDWNQKVESSDSKINNTLGSTLIIYMYYTDMYKVILAQPERAKQYIEKILALDWNEPIIRRDGSEGSFGRLMVIFEQEKKLLSDLLKVGEYADQLIREILPFFYYISNSIDELEFKTKLLTFPGVVENLSRLILEYDWTRIEEDSTYEVKYLLFWLFTLPVEHKSLLEFIYHDPELANLFAEKLLALDWSNVLYVTEEHAYIIIELLAKELSDLDILNWLFSHKLYSKLAKRKLLSLDQEANYYLVAKLISTSRGEWLVEQFKGDDEYFLRFIEIFLALDWDRKLWFSTQYSSSIAHVILDITQAGVFFAAILAYTPEEKKLKFFADFTDKFIALDWKQPVQIINPDLLSLGNRFLYGQTRPAILRQLIKNKVAGTKIIEKLLELPWDVLEKRSKDNDEMSIACILVGTIDAAPLFEYMLNHRQLANKVIEKILSLDWNQVNKDVTYGRKTLGETFAVCDMGYKMLSKVENLLLINQLNQKLLSLNWNKIFYPHGEESETLAEVILFYKDKENNRSFLNNLLLSADLAEAVTEKILSLDWSRPSYATLVGTNFEFTIEFYISRQLGKTFTVTSLQSVYKNNPFAYLFLINSSTVMQKLFEKIGNQQRERIALKFLDELDFTTVFEKRGRGSVNITPVWFVYFKEVLEKIVDCSDEFRRKFVDKLEQIDFELRVDKSKMLFCQFKFWNALELWLCQPENERELIKFAMKRQSSPQFKAKLDEQTKNVSLIQKLQRLDRECPTIERLNEKYQQIKPQAQASIDHTLEVESSATKKVKKKKKKKGKKKSLVNGHSQTPSLYPLDEGAIEDRPDINFEFMVLLDKLKLLPRKTIRNKIFLLQEISEQLAELQKIEEHNQDYLGENYCKLISELIDEALPKLATQLFEKDSEEMQFILACRKLFANYRVLLPQGTIDFYEKQLLELSSKVIIREKTSTPLRFSSPISVNRARSVPNANRQSPARQSIGVSSAKIIPRFATPQKRATSPFLGIKKPEPEDIRVERGEGWEQIDIIKFQASIDNFSRDFRQENKLAEVTALAVNLPDVSTSNFTLNQASYVTNETREESSAYQNAAQDDESPNRIRLNKIFTSHFIQDYRPIIKVYAITDIVLLTGEKRPIFLERRCSFQGNYLFFQLGAQGEVIYPAHPVNYALYNYQIAGRAEMIEEESKANFGLKIKGFLSYVNNATQFFPNPRSYMIYYNYIPYVPVYFYWPRIINHYFFIVVNSPQNDSMPSMAQQHVIQSERSDIKLVLEDGASGLDAISTIQELKGETEIAIEFFNSVVFNTNSELKQIMIKNACDLFIERVKAEKIDITCLTSQSTEELFDRFVLERLRPEDLEKIMQAPNIVEYINKIANQEERFNLQYQLVVALSKRFCHENLFTDLNLDQIGMKENDFALDQPLRFEFLDRLIKTWQEDEKIRRNNTILLPVLVLSMRDEVDCESEGAHQKIRVITAEERMINVMQQAALLIARLDQFIVDKVPEKNKIYSFPILKENHYILLTIKGSEEGPLYRIFDPLGFDFKQKRVDDDIAFILAVLSSYYQIQPLKAHRNERIQPINNNFVCGSICMAVMGHLISRPSFFEDGCLPANCSQANFLFDDSPIRQINVGIRSMPDINAEYLIDLVAPKKERKVHFSLTSETAIKNIATSSIP